MDISEKYGTSIEEATKLALEDLGITEDKAVITVLEEPTSGFFGVGAKVAKVRVEKIDSFHAANSAEANDYSEGEMGNSYKKRDLRKKPQMGGYNPQGSHTSQGQRTHSPNSGGRPSGGRDFNRRDNNVKVESVHPVSKESVFNKSKLTPIDSHEMLDWVNSLIASMQCELEATAYRGEDFVYIDLTGRDAKVIIGKRGATLNSIQYLANIVYNKAREVYERVVIDVEGYRIKRERSLETLAQRLSAKVVRSGRPARLEPMNPYERKVIHSALQFSTQVLTKSEGEEPYRRVVILRKR